ncbi:hypothetical protein AHF37_06566 [Paragonimus kellicotti]|nr:hypothetical protein AHF37_06566 [Paragonimus kellicotti]
MHSQLTALRFGPTLRYPSLHQYSVVRLAEQYSVTFLFSFSALSAPFVSVHVKDKRGSMRASFLLIFAMIQCICGFVFPICDAFALTDKWTQFATNHKYYLEGFSMFQNIGAILFLAYLQLLITWFGISTENNFAKDVSINRRSDKNRRLFNERPPKRLGRFEIRQVDEVSDMSSEPLCHSLLWVPKHLLRLILGALANLLHIQISSYCTTRTQILGPNGIPTFGCVSDTLKQIEATVDGSANIVQDILAYVFSRNGFESGGTEVNEHGLSILQNSSFVAANVSNLAGEVRKHVDLYTQYHRPQVDCQAHLGNTLKPFLFPLIIEYCLITGTLFYQMLQRVGQKSPFKSNIRGRLPMTSVEVLAASNAGSSGTGVVKHTSLKEKACEKHTYYRQLLDDVGEEQVQVYSPQACDPNNIINTIQTRLRRRHRDSHCHRSHTGLFLGLMIFTASCIAISFFLGRNKINLLRFTPNIYQHWKMFVLSTSLLSSVLALIQTNQLKFRRRKSSESFEYSLLGLGLLGYLAFYMLLFVPSLEAIVHVYLYGTTTDQRDTKFKAVDRMNTLNLDRLVGTAWLYMGKSVLEIVQVLAQFFFIIEASRRGPCCVNQAAIKPGRSTIAFLLIANLALWLVNTFEARHTEQQLILYKHYFGLRTWPIITCCFIPSIIFFRSHSTVCLA